MKILFFIDSLRSGGKERRLVELIKGLSTNSDLKMEIVLTKKGIHYQDLFSTNIKIHYTVRKDGLKKDPSIFYKFYKIAQKFKPDIIHVWETMVAIYAIPAKLLLNIPMINNEITKAPEKVEKGLLSHNLSFLFSDVIISNSYAGIKAYNPPKNKSMVIYNGFDFNRIKELEKKETVKKKINISTKFIIGMVASFSDKKDYETYIKAANRVLLINSNITFLCIGSEDDAKYREIVKQENRSKILFLGKQNNVENIMNICDIGILMTNNSNHGEGISNALLEFLALGKPVIANFNGGNNELVTQGVTGYLTTPKSDIELSEKILYLIDNEDVRMSFGKKGIKRIETDFTIEKMINDFKKIYQEKRKLHG